MPLQSIQIGAAFLLSVFYIPFISGAATNTRWCLLSVMIPTFLIALHKDFRFTKELIILILFFAYSAISCGWSFSDQSIYDLMKLLILIEAFILGSLLTSIENVFKGLALGLTISSILILLGVSGGLFVNINTLAETSVIVLVGLCVYQLWYFIPGLLPSIFINGSRGAILTLCIVFGFWLWQKSKNYTLLLTLIVLSVILISLALGYRTDTLNDRLIIWEYTLKNITLLGQGLGTFHLTGFYNIRSGPIFVHNDLLQIGFELGLVGVGLIVFFFTRVIMEAQKEKYIVGTVFIISLFDFPLYLPVSACILFMVCGFISRNGVNIFNSNIKSRIGLLS